MISRSASTPLIDRRFSAAADAISRISAFPASLLSRQRASISREDISPHGGAEIRHRRSTRELSRHAALITTTILLLMRQTKPMMDASDAAFILSSGLPARLPDERYFTCASTSRCPSWPQSADTRRADGQPARRSAWRSGDARLLFAFMYAAG